MWFKNAYKFRFRFEINVLIYCLSLLTTLSEIFGVSIFLPIFQYIKYDGNINLLNESSVYGKYIIALFSIF